MTLVLMLSVTIGRNTLITSAPLTPRISIKATIDASVESQRGSGLFQGVRADVLCEHSFRVGTHYVRNLGFESSQFKLYRLSRFQTGTNALTTMGAVNRSARTQSVALRVPVERDFSKVEATPAQVPNRQFYKTLNRSYQMYVSVQMAIVYALFPNETILHNFSFLTFLLPS